MVSGFGVAASEAPIADSATAKVFNTSLVGPNLRQTAEEAKDDVVIRRGVGVEDPAGEVGYSFGPRQVVCATKPARRIWWLWPGRSPSIAQHFRKTDRLFLRCAGSMWNVS